jgi:hypothetical protein
MAEESFFLKLPAFVLFSPTDGTPLVHRDGERKHIPMFTDDDSVKTFVERTKIECVIKILHDSESVERFLSGFKHTDLVPMDPLDDQLRTQTAYTVGQILASIARMKSK